MKVIAVIFAVLSGCCLLLIQLRKDLPHFGSIISSKVHEELSKVSLLSMVLFDMLTLSSMSDVLDIRCRMFKKR